MTLKEFSSNMRMAKAYEEFETDLSLSHFWRGYQMGLRRLYHGENFGELQRHQYFMDVDLNKCDEFRQQLVLGYRAGYRADLIEDKIKEG